MVNKKALFTSGRTGEMERDEWQTPSWLFGTLDREFKFTLDPAATPENALCENYFCDTKAYPTALGDGLISPWNGVAFVNPPYSRLKEWVAKGYKEAREGRANVVMLLPARTDTRAWWSFVRWGEVRFLPGRLKFGMSEENILKIKEKNILREIEGKKPLSLTNSAPFPSAVVIFENNPLQRPSTFYWNIRGTVQKGSSSSANTI